MDDLLQRIQSLQFTDRTAAEQLALAFIRATFPTLDAAAVELRPLAVSLNSFNGFLSLESGRRLFFKTHTEPDGVIGEYYRGEQLADAGYPVLRPIMQSTEAGKQLLIYEVITDPSVFDLSWSLETGQGGDLDALMRAQHAADDELLRLHLQTLAWQEADDAARAPVHQLFYHRLTGGRLARFYAHENAILLPGGTYTMRQVRTARWHINGQQYDVTLDDLIGDAIRRLNPAQAGASVLGHGDAHNGNVFYVGQGGTEHLLYFDPAFAGRHHPLLDLTKPLFHNVFAMWMYYPQEKRDATHIRLSVDGDVFRVEHDYALHPVRRMFVESKVQRVLIPIVRELRARGWLDENWRAYLKAALFCCPLLTKNLADSTTFTPEISLLGLCHTLEMGGMSVGQPSFIDALLDDAAQSV